MVSEIIILVLVLGLGVIAAQTMLQQDNVLLSVDYSVDNRADVSLFNGCKKRCIMFNDVSIWRSCDHSGSSCGLVCKGLINSGDFEGQPAQADITPCVQVRCECGPFVEVE